MSTHPTVDRCELRGWYTPDEAAEVLDVQPATVRVWCRERRIDRVKLPGRQGKYRIPADAVRALMPGAS